MMERGEVFWVDFSPQVGSEQAGRRPGIIASRNAINEHSRVVLVVPLTTRPARKVSSEVTIEAPEGGLTADSTALALQVRALDKQRIGDRMGQLEPATMTRIERALKIVFDLP